MAWWASGAAARGRRPTLCTGVVSRQSSLRYAAVPAWPFVYATGPGRNGALASSGRRTACRARIQRPLARITAMPASWRPPLAEPVAMHEGGTGLHVVPPRRVRQHRCRPESVVDAIPSAGVLDPRGLDARRSVRYRYDAIPEPAILGPARGARCRSNSIRPGSYLALMTRAPTVLATTMPCRPPYVGFDAARRRAAARGFLGFTSKFVHAVPSGPTSSSTASSCTGLVGSGILRGPATTAREPGTPGGPG